MSSQCYFLIQEENWIRLNDLIQVIGFFQALSNTHSDQKQLEIMSDELTAFLVLVRRELELLQKAPSVWLESDKTPLSEAEL